MSKRITILDIAKKLNVSTTTVNKALSGKPKVSEETRKLIIATAEEMGYKPNKFAQALARRQLKIGVVVSRTPYEFARYAIQGFEKGFEDFQDYNVKGILRTIDSTSSTEQSMKVIRDFTELGVDGIIIQPVMGYKEYIDLIDKTVKHGIKVVAAISKLYENTNAGCVRINSQVVGQLAGQFMNMVLARDSKVAVLTANHEMQIHREYVEGFNRTLDKNKVNLIGIFETQDQEYVAYNQTEKLLKEHPDLKGIYVTSYVSVPVSKCIKEHNKESDIIVIGQDLSPDLVKNLIDGSLTATIFQNQFLQGRKAVEMMYDYLTGVSFDGDEYLVTPELVMTSNLSCYDNKY